MRIEHWFYAVPLRLRSLFRRSGWNRIWMTSCSITWSERTEEYIAQGLTPGRSRAKPPCARWTVSRNAKRSAATCGR